MLPHAFLKSIVKRSEDTKTGSHATHDFSRTQFSVTPISFVSFELIIHELQSAFWFYIVALQKLLNPVRKENQEILAFIWWEVEKLKCVLSLDCYGRACDSLKWSSNFVQNYWGAPIAARKNACRLVIVAGKSYYNFEVLRYIIRTVWTELV